MFEVRICRRLLTLKRLFGQMESPAEIKSLVSQKKKKKALHTRQLRGPPIALLPIQRLAQAA